MHVVIWESKYVLFIIGIHLLLFPLETECQCVVPLANGSWETSSRGTWQVPDDRSGIRNFRAAGLSTSITQDLECLESQGNDMYILGFSQILFGAVTYSYTCLVIPTPSSSIYTIYLATEIDPNLHQPFTTDNSSVCSVTEYTTADRTLLALPQGTSASGIMTVLPDSLRGHFFAEATDQHGQTGNYTLYATCADVTHLVIAEIVNVTYSTSNIGFSAGGTFLPIYTTSSGDTSYVYMYNNDSSVVEPATYRYTCWVIRALDGRVYVTIRPEICHSDQNATYVTSGGHKLVMTSTESCSPSEGSDDNSTVIIIVVCVVVAVIVIGIVVIVVIICYRRSKNKDTAAVVEDVHQQNGGSTLQGTASHRAGNARAKSSNDVGRTKLLDGNLKKTKAVLKKPETRTIAVQASIWMGPINQVKRTSTGLKPSGLKRTTSQTSDKFIPYIGCVRRREGTHSETRSQQQSYDTEIENPPVQTVKALDKEDEGVAKEKPRVMLTSEVKEIDPRTLKRFSEEYEKKHPFPREGNLKAMSVRTSESIETLNRSDDTQHHTCIVKKASDTKASFVANTVQFRTPDSDGVTVIDDTPSTKTAKPADTDFVVNKHANVQFSQSKKQNDIGADENDATQVRERSPLKSARSRPSTTDGVLGLSRERTEPIRQTNSAGMQRTKTIISFSYNSPYALSNGQKGYLARKNSWIRDRVLRGKQNKQQIEERRKQQNEKAFEQWLKHKKSHYAMPAVKKRATPMTRSFYSSRSTDKTNSTKSTRTHTNVKNTSEQDVTLKNSTTGLTESKD